MANENDYWTFAIGNHHNNGLGVGTLYQGHSTPLPGSGLWFRSFKATSGNAQYKHVCKHHFGTNENTAVSVRASFRLEYSSSGGLVARTPANISEFPSPSQDSVPYGYSLRLYTANQSFMGLNLMARGLGSSTNVILHQGGAPVGPGPWRHYRLDVIPVPGTLDIVRAYYASGGPISEVDWTLAAEVIVSKSQNYYVPPSPDLGCGYFAYGSGSSVCIDNFTLSSTSI